MLSDKISDLYSAGEISGYVYLACVEHDILTVGDIIEQGLLENPECDWATQLRPFIEEASLEKIDNNCLPSNETEGFLSHIQEIYEVVYKGLDVRTASAIKTLESEFPSLNFFLSKLILGDSDLWKRLKELHAVGRKTVNRAHDFAIELENAFRRKGISVDELIPVSEPNEEESGGTIVGNKDLSQFGETALQEIVREAISGLSVRSTNALLLILKECGSYKSFCDKITSEDFDVKSIRNIGRKSLPEIRSFVSVIKRVFIDISDTLSIESDDSVDNIDRFQALFENKMQELSVRSFHAVDALYRKCGRSLTQFMKIITHPDFRVASLPAIGRKSAAEIIDWIQNFRTIITGPSETHDIAEREARAYTLSKLGLIGNVVTIEEVSAELGHFAFFLAIWNYITQLNSRDRAIIDSQLKIYQGQILQNRKETAKALNITPERMRQLRIAIFKKLRAYISLIHKIGEQYEPRFRYNLSEISSINNQEYTHFNNNFILWTISCLMKNEYELLGDPETAFANPYGYEVNLVLVPKALSGIFDFHSFVHYFEELQETKRADDMLIPLQDSIIRFFKDRVYYEKLDELSFHCRHILRSVFGFDVNNDVVVVERNASRNNTEWVELIIREVGHPMTIEELYDELEKRHPGKSKSPIALAGAVRMNPNLVPIGRSSTFGLREWSEGAHRGGTIREFAAEYLLSLDKPIAQLPDIAKYVRQYRPSSSDKSINSNLLLEANGAFDIFFKGDTRYIGLSGYDYGEEYRRYDRKKDAKRDFKTSCTLLEEFVAENGRLPFSHRVNDDEKRLARFWNVQLAQLEKGLLEEEDKEIIESMVERFAGLKIHKKEFDWLQTYETIRRAIENGFGISSLSHEKQVWLSKQIRSYKYSNLSDSHMKQIEELVKLIKDNAYGV